MVVHLSGDCVRVYPADCVDTVLVIVQLCGVCESLPCGLCRDSAGGCSALWCVRVYLADCVETVLVVVQLSGVWEAVSCGQEILAVHLVTVGVHPADCEAVLFTW